MRLDKMLGIKYPFIQGGMANIATGEFAAAVSNAGGLGLIGAGGMNTDMLRENIRKCRTLTDKPFGVNLMLMNPEADAMAELLVEENVKIVTTGAGSPAKYMEKWKSNGMMVIPVVSSAALAIRMERFGADAVVAEGTESGGHVGEMTTMTLVPKVVDSVNIPVIGPEELQMADSLQQHLHLVLQVYRWELVFWQVQSVLYMIIISRQYLKQRIMTR